MKHNWGYKPFAKVLKTITPTSKIDKSEYKLSGIYPIISQEDTFISGYWNNNDDVTQHSSPVVIFGDHSRVLKYIDFEFVVGADGVKIIQPTDLLSAKFLYHFLKWYKVPSLGYARHFKLLKEINYPVPPMETQEQIVAELDQINDLIAKNRELLSQLDALAQSLFYDTFGDPMTNPKGWGTQHFESCIHKIKYPSKKLLTTEYFSSGKYPIVSQEDSLISGYSDREDCVFHISNPVIVFGDHTRILKYVSFSFVLGADGVKILSPINTLSPRYFYFCLLLFKIPSLGYSRHYKLLKELKIPIPPLALQEDFAAKVEAIEAQKAKVEAEIAELQTLLDARMDYWFN
ncbi:MAG: hypothetical protein HDS42_08255 [Bacteroides sp.]|nr:hypothetical protein [Bacteroides sp.]